MCFNRILFWVFSRINTPSPRVCWAPVSSCMQKKVTVWKHVVGLDTWWDNKDTRPIQPSRWRFINSSNPMCYETLNWEAHWSLLTWCSTSEQFMCMICVMSVDMTGVHGFLRNTPRVRRVTKTDTLRGWNCWGCFWAALLRHTLR